MIAIGGSDLANKLNKADQEVKRGEGDLRGQPLVPPKTNTDVKLHLMGKGGTNVQVDPRNSE